MVKKAIIPAAGLGTRFLPATKASPKEMLPIIDTPTIQYVVQEAVDSGIEDILIISGRGKRAIEDHFDRNYELEERIKGKEDMMYDEIRNLTNLANIHFIRQKDINGLGDAIYYARQHTGNEPFAVLLGDTIIDSVIPVTQQLMDIYEQYQSSVIAVETVPRDKVSRYGIVGGDALSEKLMRLNQLIEKPSVETAPSNLAIAGRYILTPGIYKALEKTPKGKGNELQLTDAMIELLKRESIYSQTFDGKRYDIGNKLDFIKTTIEYAVKRKEFSSKVIAFMKEIIAEHGEQNTVRYHKV